MIRPYGPRRLLVETDGPAAAAALAELLRGVPGAEVVPAARTVLVSVERDRDLALVRALLAEGAPTQDGAAEGPEVALPVVYDGPDLPLVAEVMGVSVEEVVRRHAAESWTAAFLGFAPGFAYLEGSGGLPEVPRRPDPRTSVPAGSVALAGRWSAVYPSASPGGWQLVGRTGARVWDVDRPEPALLAVGSRVRFRPVRDLLRASSAVRPSGTRPGTTKAEPGGPAVEVARAGPATTVQDLGRPGLAHLGVPRSGAADRGAAVRANRLVGNARGDAVLEVTVGGAVLRARTDLVLAVTGATGPVLLLEPDGPVRGSLTTGAPFPLPHGWSVELAPAVSGARRYVAVRGGLATEVVLGSRSTDTLSGLGTPVVDGDVLPVGPPPGAPVEPAIVAAPTTVEDDDGPLLLRVAPGPRVDHVEDGLAAVTGRAWRVAPRSDRVGVRLEGRALRVREGELPSEPTVPGAVQVPPSGLPLVFLADHPVTGGYPVVAVVLEGDLDLLAQRRPGQEVRLVAAPGCADAPALVPWSP